MPTHIPGLRSPSETVNGLVYFGRMIDKIRLHADRQLPEDWASALGNAYPNSFDARCCRFLQIEYDALVSEVLAGRSEEHLLQWAYTQGRQPSEEEIEIWNAYMTKLGWRDAITERVKFRLQEASYPENAVETMFEFIDLDEGRLEL
ncbi:MAG: DUF5069 domain-containing protein [Verrucomicrobiota bacterium]